MSKVAVDLVPNEGLLANGAVPGPTRMTSPDTFLVSQVVFDIAPCRCSSHEIAQTSAFSGEFSARNCPRLASICQHEVESWGTFGSTVGTFLEDDHRSVCPASAVSSFEFLGCRHYVDLLLEHVRP